MERGKRKKKRLLRFFGGKVFALLTLLSIFFTYDPVCDVGEVEVVLSVTEACLVP